MSGATLTLSRIAGEGGPGPQGRVGEGLWRGDTLTRLATLGTLSRGAGEGFYPEPAAGPCVVSSNGINSSTG